MSEKEEEEEEMRRRHDKGPQSAMVHLGSSVKVQTTSAIPLLPMRQLPFFAVDRVATFVEISIAANR